MAANNDFLTFIELYGVELNDNNVLQYNSLFAEFNKSRTQGESLERNFIKWSRNYKSENIPSKQLTPVYASLPSDLAKVKDENRTVGNFYSFTLDQIANDTRGTSQFDIDELLNNCSQPQQNPLPMDTTQEIDNTETLQNSTTQTAPTTITNNEQNTAKQNQNETDGIEIIPARQQPKGKNIQQLKNAYMDLHKRKKTMPCTVVPTKERKTVGRPTRTDILTKIANDPPDFKTTNKIYCKDLILLNNKKIEKKRKTILTKYNHNLRVRNSKYFTVLNILVNVDCRKKH
ncbi:Hypothetical predicted protein [Paramuricea clavata]|uniref:Uncharacterized protein n=1 Tax=Paramuricea clavata TaxID=317549 RepID=A0A6S7H910_PARCT|nr:Hypothetical predicted protein [Paramuricea clavata]